MTLSLAQIGVIAGGHVVHTEGGLGFLFAKGILYVRVLHSQTDKAHILPKRQALKVSRAKLKKEKAVYDRSRTPGA